MQTVLPPTLHCKPMGLFLCANTHHPYTRGLVAAWPCTEGAGSVYDVVSNIRLDRSGSAAWTYKTFGAFGLHALDCITTGDDDDDWRFSGAQRLGFADTVSILAIINFDAVNARQSIFSAGAYSTGPGWGLNIDTTPNGKLRWNKMGVTGVNGTSATALSAGIPYLVVGHSGNGLDVTFWTVNLRTYEFRTEVIANSNGMNAPGATATCAIGNWVGSSNSMDGQVGLVEVYRRKLTTEEIIARAANPLLIYQPAQYYPNISAAVGGGGSAGPLIGGRLLRGGILTGRRLVR